MQRRTETERREEQIKTKAITPTTTKRKQNKRQQCIKTTRKGINSNLTNSKERVNLLVCLQVREKTIKKLYSMQDTH